LLPVLTNLVQPSLEQGYTASFSSFAGRKAIFLLAAILMDAPGRATVRRMQWEKAQTGDTSMLIWLGKILCGQRDTSVVAVTSPNGGPVRSERVVVPVTDPIEAARVYQKFMSGD
jgi:hypothetical protein